MYNVEKYIGACLTSLLNQTFQDFEVVVVDNGSTDNSAAVLESYVPKFGGRLKTLKIEKNSGGPSPAYNKAIAFSRGKYVFVMDSDDLLINNALETFYTFAENFQADVVSICRVIEFVSDTEKMFPSPENLIIKPWPKYLVDEPTLETEDLAERIKKFCSDGIHVTAWSKLVRRDLLIENDITFPLSKGCADFIWTIEVLCCAKKFLHIPQPLYIYRHLASSISHFNRENYKTNHWNESTVECVKFLANFMSRIKFFQENPQYQFMLLDSIERSNFGQAMKGYLKIPVHEIYSAFASEIEKSSGENSALIAYLCTSANFSRLRWTIANQRIIELENQLKQIQGG